jgi:hypothetical protein
MFSGELPMIDWPFILDNERQGRILDRIDEILTIRGAQEGLKTSEDVVFLAVEELWRKVMSSSSAELYQHCVWRKNLK